MKQPACLYFKLHHPLQLKQYASKDIGSSHDYEDALLNEQMIHNLAEHSWLPANAVIMSEIKSSGYKIKIRYSMSGIVIEQLQKYRPDVIKSFQELSDTGCVEIAAESYYHSLSFFYSKNEFNKQVRLHAAIIKDVFDVDTKITGESYPSAHRLNTHQHELLTKLYSLENLINNSQDEKLIRNWRMLQTSDYIYDTAFYPYYKNMITDLEILLIKEQIRINKLDFIPLTHNIY